MVLITERPATTRAAAGVDVLEEAVDRYVAMTRATQQLIVLDGA